VASELERGDAKESWLSARPVTVLLDRWRGTEWLEYCLDWIDGKPIEFDGSSDTFGCGELGVLIDPIRVRVLKELGVVSFRCSSAAVVRDRARWLLPSGGVSSSPPAECLLNSRRRSGSVGRDRTVLRGDEVPPLARGSGSDKGEWLAGECDSGVTVRIVVSRKLSG
jgi:hypothetical protein